MTASHTVTFIPLNKTVEVEEGTTILEACLDNEIDLEHACGGFCACTTCHVIIKKGESSLSEMEFDEEDKLDTCEGVTLRSRLGCQSRIEGNLTIEIPPKPY
jgi:2Fe-2S ferredoxin